MNTTKEQPRKTEENKGAETSAPATKVANQKTVEYTPLEKMMIQRECVNSRATNISPFGSALRGIKLH